MLSPDQLANPKYGVLYLPTFTFLYLWTIPKPEPMSLAIFSIPNPEVYPVFAVVGFVGATLAQNIFEAIFGPEGPAVNPKYETTALKHTFAILMNLDPSRITESEMLSTPRAIREISRVAPASKATRGLLLMIPVYALRWLMIYSILLLLFYLWRLKGDFVLTILVLGTSVIFVQKYVSGLFPQSGAVESAEFLDVPEYKRFEIQRKERRDLY